MKTLTKTKKLTLAVILSGSVIIAGIGTAIAHQNANMNHGGYGMGATEYQLDEKTIELQNKFQNETTELRKKMFSTHAEMRAVMSSATPDSKEAARLAAELFDIKEQLHKKAEELGLNTNRHGMMGFGGGMMDNGMHKRGMMSDNFNHPCNER
jgi:hypothetical protein